MLAEYPPKVLEVLSLKRFFPQCQVYKMCISLNNIAHKNHLKICSESRVEGQCFPKENKKLPVHSKFQFKERQDYSKSKHIILTEKC